MSARAIVSGVLFRAPVEKTSKAGKAYVLATIRETLGDGVRWWKCFVFSESAIEELMRLGDGEPVSVAGQFDCELYAPAGDEARLSWTIRADAVLSARPKPKTAKPQTAKPSTQGGFDFDDSIPF